MDNSGLGNSIIELGEFGGGQIEEINNYNALQDALIRESHEDRGEFSTPAGTLEEHFTWDKVLSRRPRGYSDVG